MKKKLFKIAYKLHLYKLAEYISPSLYWYELGRKACEGFAKGVAESG